MNQSIAEDTAAQNALVGKIVASINETSNIASESTEGAVEIERIGSEINRLAQELACLVSDFSSTKQHQR